MEKSLKSKIAAITMILALSVTALLGIFFGQPIQRYNAAGDVNGLRFQQVAVGKDFAIGLTYDGDIYGWDTVAKEGNNALGVKYGTNPKKIDVELVVGPTYNSNTQSIMIDNTISSDDKITKIAATLNTAAFITENGNIYTWGHNDLLYNSNYGLLLNDSGDYTTSPQIIDYNNNSGNLSAVKSMVKLFPNDNMGVFPNKKNALLDIVGSDYNYIIKHERGNGTYYFGWGSAEYVTSGEIFSEGVTAGLYNFRSANVNDIGDADMAVAMGGGTLVLADTAASNLLVRGKNYYIPYGGTDGANNYLYDMGTTTQLSAADSSLGDIQYLKLDNIFNISVTSSAGGFDFTDQVLRLSASVDGGEVSEYGVPVNSAIVVSNKSYNTEGNNQPNYDFYSVEGLNGSVIAKNSIAFKNAQTDSANDIPSKATTLSMGNGYGYFISDGKLYFFGNGYNGQSGSLETVAKKGYNSVTQLTQGFTGVPVAVAAGKTSMGKRLYSSLNEVSFNGSGNLAITQSSDKYSVDLSEFADGDEYLSGLISRNSNVYEVYVWNKSHGFTSLSEQFSALGVSGSENNRIINLYSGYGNNLIALSSLGKIYQIQEVGGEFRVEIKDSFATGAGKVANYTINQSNKIDFAISNGRPADAGQTQTANVYAVLSLNGLQPSSEDAITSDTQYNNVISTNVIGDAYRILLSDNDKNLIARGVISDKLVSDATQTVDDNGGIHFYFKDDMENEIPKEILAHYLDYTVNVSGSDVSIRITPYQSTKEKTIVMQYYVARYDTYANYQASLSDSFLFYDYDIVNTEITIANTQAHFNYFNNRVDGVETNNISIPVLDPNNTKNNMYSIALTNVQYGLENFGKYFGLNGDSLANFNQYIIQQAYANDNGFPASQKVTDGYLTRYFNEAGTDKNFKHSTYYNDKYQFIAFDSDGDKLAFENSTFEAFNSASEYFSCSGKTISFSIPLNSEGFTLTDLSADTLSYFNNIYGLNLSIANVGGVQSLNVSYDVLQLEAIKSTGNLQYTNNDIRMGVTGAAINQLPRYSLTLSETFYNNQTNSQEVVYNGTNEQVIVPAYVQSSMITTMQASDDEYYRSEQGYNKFVVRESTITVGAAADVGRIFTFDLQTSSLFKDYTNIYLTYKTEGDETSYTNYGTTGFAGGFDNTLVNVSLDRNTFKFEAKAPSTYTVEIELRRFTSGDMSQPIMSSGSEAELITLIFKITALPSSFQTGALTQLSTQTIGTETAYSVTNFTSARDAVFSFCMSTNENVATVKLSPNKKEMIVTPVSSGSISIEFDIIQYVCPKSGSFKANVESRSVLSETVGLITSETIYLSDLKTEISKNYKVEDGEAGFNSKEYSIDKQTDTVNAPNGYYFVQRSINDSGLIEWNIIPQPQFIGRIEIVNDDNEVENAIEISLGEYDVKGSYDNIMLVVKFVGTNGKKFEAAVKVTPTKKFLLNADNTELNIDINVKDTTSGSSDSVVKREDDYVISAKFLLDKASLSNENYNINLVNADSSAYSYFNISNIGNSIIINPIKSTVEPQVVNVSVSDGRTPYVLTFTISISGIIEVLPKSTYVTIWLACSISVFALLFIIFVIRMGVYWKKKAEQKRIIKKNQMLIKMRDKVHNKTEAISKEQIVQTKLKMEDPKYAKMFNDMKKTTEERTGITLDNSTVARKAEAKTKAVEKTKKKKNGKKSIDELKAELAAKKEAFAKMQMGEEIPLADISADPSFTGGYSDGMSREDIESQINDKINADDNILFDVETLDDNK